MSNDTTPAAAVILAGGKGTRMKSSRAKALFPLCGQPMIYYPIRASQRAGIERIVVVVGHQAEDVRTAAGDQVTSVLQEPQLGTGHALMCTEDTLRGFAGTLFVHCVDVPLLPDWLITDLLEAHRASGAAATLLTVHLPDAGKYGRIVRTPDGDVARIVEARDATPEELALTEINTGVYCFIAPLIFDVLREVTPDNDQQEYYLTDVVALLRARGARVAAMAAPSPEIVAGINDRVQLAESEAQLRAEIRRRHMLNGVTLLDPVTTFIDEDVEIGQDTVIHPFNLIYAGTRIGAECVVGPSCQLFAAVLEDTAEVCSSRIEKSIVRAGAKVGPFARLRPGCDIAPGAEIGNFSELKNTRVGARSKVHHHGYLGDTTLGEDANIGAGTITCNYDGKRKHPTTIGDRAFIGSGNLLVAPVEIGPDALTGAGAVVTHDVPAGKVAYGLPARVVKDRE